MGAAYPLGFGIGVGADQQARSPFVGTALLSRSDRRICGGDVTEHGVRQLVLQMPTLYLLHGLSDDATTWARRTSIERYATELGIAVVMPQVAKSFYSDEVYGDPYWTFLTEELPVLARSFFHLSDRREDTFVAGLSMGGYGAFQWALRKPEQIAAAASLSGALDVASLHEAVLERGEGFEVLRKVYGDTSVRGTDSDLLHLLSTVDPATLPALYQMCGTEDFLLQSNLDFRDTAARHGVPVTVDLRPGDHSWGLWDTTVQDVLAWLPLR